MTTTQEIKLSDEQKALVHYNEGEGALLVVAAAGSGKTRILTERVNYLLTKKEGNFSVLCLTFTTKAAQEMKERLQNVPTITKRAFIGTIHEFALQVLISKRHVLGFDDVPHIIDREQDQKELIEQVFLDNPILANEYKLLDDKGKKEKISDAFFMINQYKRALQSSELTDLELLIFQHYNQLLQEQNMIDYNDILYYAYKLFSENQASARVYQRIYRYILVDEAQDLSYAQYHLIKAICGVENKNVFMVGDPNQAIHSYAGANTKFMLDDFIRDFDTKKEEIKQNFRSSKKVIELANKIMLNGSRPEDAHYTGKAAIFSFENSTKEAEWILSDIKQMIINKLDNEEIEGVISLDKIAILARNRFVFLPFEELMENDDFFKNNYFIKKSADGIELETNFMKIFDLGTRIICNPNDQLHFREIFKILKISSQNLTTNTLEQLFSLNENIDNCLKVSILIEVWQKLLQNENMSDALNNLSVQIQQNETIRENLKDYILNDIEYYRIVWRTFLKDSNNANKSLVGFRQFVAMGINNSHKNKGLTLATVHTVKGLQYDIVYIVGMKEGAFPDFRAETEEKLKEEKNIAYVAVTRAKRWIYLTFPKTITTKWGNTRLQTKSRFISNISHTDI
jgi:DNA helicase II / ATP-dependent DNA helicase PcrA